MAAVSIAGPVYTVMMAIGTMLGGGGCVLIARTLGEKDDSKFKLYSSLCCWGSLAFGLLFTVLCLLNSRAVVELFLKEPEALALGQEMISLLVLSGPFLGLYHIGSNFLQAAGNASLVTLVSMLRQGIFFLPLLYLLNAAFAVKGNVAAHVVADIGAAAVAVILALRQYRILKASET